AAGSRVALRTAASFVPSREPARTAGQPHVHSSCRLRPLAEPARITPLCTPLRCSTNTLEMSAGTSFPAVEFLPAEPPLRRRLLAYFPSGAYIPVLALLSNYDQDNCLI